MLRQVHFLDGVNILHCLLTCFFYEYLVVFVQLLFNRLTALADNARRHIYVEIYLYNGNRQFSTWRTSSVHGDTI